MSNLLESLICEVLGIQLKSLLLQLIQHFEHTTVVVLVVQNFKGVWDIFFSPFSFIWVISVTILRKLVTGMYTIQYIYFFRNISILYFSGISLKMFELSLPDL